MENVSVEMVLMMAIRLLMWTTVETVVQLSKGDVDRDSSERKSIAKTDDIGMISGYNNWKKFIAKKSMEIRDRVTVYLRETGYENRDG